MIALDHLCACDSVDEFLQPEPVEHPLTEVRYTFADDQGEMLRLLKTVGSYASAQPAISPGAWPARSEGHMGRIDSDGTVHCQCPGCHRWLTVEPVMSMWVVACDSCVESDDGHARRGTGHTRLAAAEEFFA